MLLLMITTSPLSSYAGYKVKLNLSNVMISSDEDVMSQFQTNKECMISMDAMLIQFFQFNVHYVCNNWISKGVKYINEQEIGTVWCSHSMESIKNSKWHDLIIYYNEGRIKNNNAFTHIKNSQKECAIEGKDKCHRYILKLIPKNKWHYFVFGRRHYSLFFRRFQKRNTPCTFFRLWQIQNHVDKVNPDINTLQVNQIK